MVSAHPQHVCSLIFQGNLVQHCAFTSHASHQTPCHLRPHAHAIASLSICSWHISASSVSSPPPLFLISASVAFSATSLRGSPILLYCHCSRHAPSPAAGPAGAERQPAQPTLGRAQRGGRTQAHAAVLSALPNLLDRVSCDESQKGRKALVSWK